MKDSYNRVMEDKDDLIERLRQCLAGKEEEMQVGGKPTSSQNVG